MKPDGEMTDDELSGAIKNFFRNTECECEHNAKETRGMKTRDMANRVCGHLPDGWTLCLVMERGAAWVTLHDSNGCSEPLPDAAGKSLEEQINDAICAATREETK